MSIYLLFFVVFTSKVECFNGARRLYNDLLLSREGYKYARPVINNSEPVIMYMNMSLTQILDVHEKNQMIILNMWVTQEWTDPKFQWDPAKYGYVYEFKVPDKEIWTPDLVLYNNAGGDWDLGSSSNTKIRMFYNSRVVWKPPIIYQLACDINVEFFPFDTQSCRLKMGTWTFDGYAIDLRHMAQKTSDMTSGRTTFDPCESSVDYAVDISDYQENVEWDLLEVSAKRNIVKYPCCNEPFLDVTFIVKIRRRTLFYGTNLICPCMAISFLTVLVFYLPSDSQEKITLSISVLIALTVFILLVFDLTPTTSLVIPLITKYLLFTMILITVSIIASIVVLNVRYRSPDTNKIPYWVRRLFIQTLPRFLFIQRPKDEDDGAAKDFLYRAGLDDDSIGQDEENMWYKMVERRGAVSTNQRGGFISELELALEGVRSIAAYMKSESETGDIEEDWKFVALVLDRLFLWLFSLAACIGILGMFMQSPSLKDNMPALHKGMAPELQKNINYTRLCNVDAL